ncbi:SDR family oxidoreductase [Sphingobium nicotianae]|uniref:SDR family oxidoreductase n=1 Tax=Sphingobium nicotianae TaxID=2782607 RepID=A0A9X1DCJ1_9SPHN|nr:SDR family oxidoreductase [Sphingobium nicotianae]MBT2187414.1 SDR family oxidoreductase [Sphingobium nicotianae]
MNIFVTGATGFVGSAIVRELLSAGHAVTGLARSDASAAALEAAGAQVLRGSIADPDILQRGASAADGVIHTAFNHDFSKFLDNCAEDARAIEALGSALVGSDRPLLVTSGVALLTDGRLATEADLPPDASAFPRRSEAAAAALAAQGLQATAVRLPPSTHGAGDHGFVPILIDIARSKGVSAYIGDGMNRWPATHRADAAKVYRLALERGATDGPYHAVAEEGIAFRQIAEAIGQGLGLPVASVAPADAETHFGWFTRFAAINVPTSSARTRDLLGWQPTQIDLLADIAQHYFAG